MSPYGYDKRQDPLGHVVPRGEPVSRVGAAPSAEGRRVRLAARQALRQDRLTGLLDDADNRWGWDASDETEGLTAVITLQDAQLGEGEIISLSVQAYHIAGADAYDVLLTFRDLTAAVLATATVAMPASTGGADPWPAAVSIEDVAIPSGTATIEVSGFSAAPTNSWRQRRIMLVKGDTAAAFVAPPRTGTLRRILLDRNLAAADVLGFLAEMKEAQSRYVLHLAQRGGGGFAVAWPAAVQLPSAGVAISAAGISLVELLYVPFFDASGDIWLASGVGDTYTVA